MGWKASGAIKDFTKTSAMIAPGVNRIGTGAGVDIMETAPN